MLGSSLPRPAGLSSCSSSVTISRDISTFPWTRDKGSRVMFGVMWPVARELNANMLASWEYHGRPTSHTVQNQWLFCLFLKTRIHLRLACVWNMRLCLCLCVLLTAMIFSPFFSQVQGHHPLTVFCSNRDTSLFTGWSSSCRLHFSGDLAGRNMWFRSMTRWPTDTFKVQSHGLYNE